MAGIGDAWGAAEELEHPRGPNGRWIHKAGISKGILGAVLDFLRNFRPRTFQNQGQANQYLQNIASRQGARRMGRLDHIRLRHDLIHTNADLFDGTPDEPSTKKFVDMMDRSATELPDDAILSRVVGVDAFGFSPETAAGTDADTNPGIRGLSGRLVADRGYSLHTMGEPPAGAPQGSVRIVVAAKKGTKVVVPAAGPSDSSILLDRNQPLRITKIRQDGTGGWTMYVMAEPHGGHDTPEPIGGPIGEGHVPSAQREQRIRDVSQSLGKREGQPDEAKQQRAEQLRREAAAQAGPVQRSPAQLAEERRVAQLTGQPEPRTEPHVGRVGGAPAGGAQPAPAPTAPEQAPLPQRTVDLKRAVLDAKVQSPTVGPRRRTWNEAYLGVQNGRKDPVDALRELDADIARMRRGEIVGDTTGMLPRRMHEEEVNKEADIQAFQGLRDVIAKQYGLEEVAPSPAPEKKVAKKAVPRTQAGLPKQEGLTPRKKAVKKAAPEPKTDLDTTVSELRKIALDENVDLPKRATKATIQQAIRDKREGKVPPAPEVPVVPAKVAKAPAVKKAVPEAAPSTAGLKIGEGVSATRIKPGDVVWVEPGKTADGKPTWLRTRKKTGSVPLTVTRNERESGNNYILHGTLPDGTEASTAGYYGQNTFYRVEGTPEVSAPEAPAKKAAKAPAAKKAAPGGLTPEETASRAAVRQAVRKEVPSAPKEPNREELRRTHEVLMKSAADLIPGKKAAKKAAPEAPGDPLDKMTKAQLLDEAKKRDLKVPQSWTKDRIKAHLRGEQAPAPARKVPPAKKAAPELPANEQRIRELFEGEKPTVTQLREYARINGMEPNEAVVKQGYMKPLSRMRRDELVSLILSGNEGERRFSGGRGVGGVPNASTVRQRILATPENQRGDYLDGVLAPLTQPQRRTLARELGIKTMGRSTHQGEVLDAIREHFRGAGGPETPATGLLDQLNANWENPMSREEAAALLANTRKAQLLEMAKELNVPGASGKTIPELRHEIVEATVGRRRDSIATRGFRGRRPGEGGLLPTTAEERARTRQAHIDRARGFGDLGTEVEQLVHDEASSTALVSRIRNRAKQAGIPEADLQPLLDAVDTNNNDRILLEAQRLTDREGVFHVGHVGDTIAFNPRVHEGKGLREGDTVRIVRPGYTARVGPGEDVQLRKATVEKVDAKEARGARLVPEGSVAGPRADTPVDNAPRRKELRQAISEAGLPQAPPGSARKSQEEITGDLLAGRITPEEAVRRFESEVAFNKEDLIEVDANLNQTDLSPDERSRLERHRANLQAAINAHEAHARWLRGHQQQDVPTLEEAKVTNPVEFEFLKDATPDDMRAAAKEAGLDPPNGNNPNEMFQDLLRQVLQREVDRRAAKKAAKAIPAKVAKKAAPEVPRERERVDAGLLAQGLDVDPKTISDVQGDLDQGKLTPRQIAERVDGHARARADSTGILYGNWEIGGGERRTPEENALRERNLQEGRSRAQGLRDFAERIRGVRRRSAKKTAPAKAPEPKGTVRAEGYLSAANTDVRVVADGNGGYIGQRQHRASGEWRDDPSLGTGNTPRDITSRQPRGQWRMVAPPRKAAPAKVAPEVRTRDQQIDDLQKRIIDNALEEMSRAKTRDQGDNALEGLTMVELRRLATQSGIKAPRTKRGLRDAILDRHVQPRLNSAAIRESVTPVRVSLGVRAKEAGISAPDFPMFSGAAGATDEANRRLQGGESPTDVARWLRERAAQVSRADLNEEGRRYKVDYDRDTLIARRKASADYLRRLGTFIQQEGKGRTPAKKAAPSAPEAPSARGVVSGARSTAPEIHNDWGMLGTGGPVEFHSDGVIGTGLEDMGQDRLMDVNGEPLSNVVGKLATRAVRGDISQDQLIEELKRLEQRLPEGSAARRGVTGMVRELDAPKRSVSLPDGTPGPLRTLMDELLKIPVARGAVDRPGFHRSQEDSEVDKLLKIAQDFQGGRLRGLRLIAGLRDIQLNLPHESQEGRFQASRAISQAIRELEKLWEDKDTRDQLIPRVKGEFSLAGV